MPKEHKDNIDELVESFRNDDDDDFLNDPLPLPPEEIPQPVREFPKLVFSNDATILGSNGAVRDYRNLTSHYSYHRPGKNGETYDYDYVSNARFRDKWFNNSTVPYELGRNHVNELRLQTMDQEQFLAPMRQIDDPQWQASIDQMTGCAEMMRAAGRLSCWYENWYYDFLGPWWVSKYKQSGDMLRMKRSMDKMALRTPTDEAIAAAMSPYMDIHSFKLYCAYNVGSVGSVDWQAWIDVMQHHVDKARRLFPDKPRYAWIQKNYPSDGFSAMELEVWNTTLDYLMSVDGLDGIIIFNLLTADDLPGWRDWFAA